MNEEIRQAITILKQGGIVIYPTDTAFGIGCKVSDQDAVQRLFTLRRRELTKAVPVLIDGKEMARRYTGTIDEEIVEQLIAPYWPGALTIIFPCISPSVSPLICGKGTTIGLRMPKHPIPLALIKGIKEGIVGCSANFAGEQTPFAFEQLNKKLLKQVDFVVHGNTGEKNVASTVIDCSVHPWRILRKGAIALSLQVV
jgi:L-threonylcarbamoyladenylate synthase